MRSSDWVRARVQKIDLYSPPSVTSGGRMRYAPKTGYVRFFEIPIRSPNWIRVRVQKMDLYTPPSVAYGGAYAIHSYNWVRAALQKTVPFLSPSGPWGGRIQYAPTTGYVWLFEIPMQFPNRIRAALQKTVSFSSPSGTLVGRMRYAPTTGYVLPFKKLSRFRLLRGHLWGVCDTPLRPGMCGPSKNCLVSVPLGAACGAYAIRPYNRIRTILRNTDAITRPGMCAPSKYLCNTPTGYVRSYEIPIRSLDRRGGDFWEVGRWGLPFAGETGVNEFGEEEDDDQNNDDKGA